MWTAIKVGVLYAAPIVSMILAVAYFAMLLVRVHRGKLAKSQAALRFATTFLLPLIVLVVVWGTGEIAGRLAGATRQFEWDPDASLQFLASLLPLVAYMYVPVIVLNAALWMWMAFSPSLRRKTGTGA